LADLISQPKSQVLDGSREEGFVLCSNHGDEEELHQGCYPNLISRKIQALFLGENGAPKIF
jgi:hypothetical protein